MGFADDFRQLLLKIQEEEGSQLRAAQKLGVSNAPFPRGFPERAGKDIPRFLRRSIVPVPASFSPDRI